MTDEKRNRLLDRQFRIAPRVNMPSLAFFLTKGKEGLRHAADGQICEER